MHSVCTEIPMVSIITKNCLHNGTVHCTYDWYDRITSDKVTFETDVSFLEILQQIISDYDLAKHNGFHHSVSGLPDMYGHILDITYASGETIYVSDNQSGFLASFVSAELITRFAEASGKVPELLPVTAGYRRGCTRSGLRYLQSRGKRNAGVARNHRKLNYKNKTLRRNHYVYL